MRRGFRFYGLAHFFRTLIVSVLVIVVLCRAGGFFLCQYSRHQKWEAIFSQGLELSLVI